MPIPQPSKPPVLISQERARDVLDLKTTRTIRNMISRGELTGYRIRGVRAVRVDLNEGQSVTITLAGQQITAQPRLTPEPATILAKIPDLTGH